MIIQLAHNFNLNKISIIFQQGITLVTLKNNRRPDRPDAYRLKGPRNIDYLGLLQI